MSSIDAAQRHSLLRRARLHDAGDVVDHGAQRERGGFELDLAGIELGDVEDIVEQRMQIVARFVDGLGDVALLVVQAGLRAAPRTGRSRRSSACGSRGS